LTGRQKFSNERDDVRRKSLPLARLPRSRTHGPPRVVHAPAMWRCDVPPITAAGFSLGTATIGDSFSK
jgi:hypothetical protein